MESQVPVRYVCLHCQCYIPESVVDLQAMVHTTTQYYPNRVIKSFERHPVRVEFLDTRAEMTEADMEAMATYYQQVTQ